MRKLVVGGGLGGLSAAHYLGGSGVRLVEASSRLGGWVNTEKCQQTGKLLETGPHTVRPTGAAGANTLKLVSSLGLAKEMYPVPRTHPAATRRMICIDSTLYPLPSTLKALVLPPKPFKQPFIFAILRDLFTPVGKSSDETAYDFIERRFGREMAEFAISPMLCGICAGDAREISIKSLLPYVFETERTHGSLIKGLFKESMKNQQQEKPPTDIGDVNKWSVWTFKNGMSTLIDALHKDITRKGCEVSMSTQITDLDLKPGKVSCVVQGKKEEFSHLFCALPANRLSDLVASQHPTMAKLLSKIPFVTVAVLNLVYKEDWIKDPAFGFLIPPSQNSSLLGVIYDSCIMPQGESTVLTAMLGGRWFNKYFSDDASPDHLRNVTMQHLRSILNISSPPESCLLSIHRDCIPQYLLGHSDLIEEINKYIHLNNLPISLIGASYSGVGVNDVILSAKTKAESFLKTSS